MSEISSQQKNIKKGGEKGASQASEHLADGEIDQLYANGVLGCGDPEVLRSTIFFLLCVYMGMRISAQGL